MGHIWCEYRVPFHYWLYTLSVDGVILNLTFTASLLPPPSHTVEMMKMAVLVKIKSLQFSTVKRIKSPLISLWALCNRLSHKIRHIHTVCERVQHPRWQFVPVKETSQTSNMSWKKSFLSAEFSNGSLLQSYRIKNTNQRYCSLFSPFI